MPSPREACRVVLFGMMGSGKSTIGRLLSARTGWPYHDNDELLQREHGLTARELLAAEDEAGMRHAEARALWRGLGLPEPCIVGAPAGTIADAENRALLKSAALIVWLRAAPETLAARAAGAEHRPWLQGKAEEWMRTTLAERDPLYASVADYSVDTDDRSPEATAEEIIAWLRTVDACGRWVRDS
jgi:shikimate kinase